MIQNLDDDPYQDIRVRGETIDYGRRECESRYEIIKLFLERYDKPFTVLDFGANYGYFSWRIKEDFPNSEITMIDSRPVLELLTKINNYDGINLISKDMSLGEIIQHGESHSYDLVLIMSIIHHFPEPESTLDAFINMGETIIIETDYPNVTNFTNSQERIYNHLMTKNPIQINKWVHHDRPIYYLNKNEFEVTGKVASGSGTSKNTTKHFNNTLGWFKSSCYPGTLNINLDNDIKFNNIMLLYGAYSLMRVYLNGFPVLALRDITADIPDNFIELISDNHLRTKFNLNDGDEVILSFCKNALEWGM